MRNCSTEPMRTYLLVAVQEGMIIVLLAKGVLAGLWHMSSYLTQEVTVLSDLQHPDSSILTRKESYFEVLKSILTEYTGKS